jgi:hypothetical protein
MDPAGEGSPNEDPLIEDAPTTTTSLPVEVCNGLDDDADGKRDSGELAGPCQAACEADAIGELASSLELPGPMTRTVAPDGNEVPELTAIRELPAFCAAPPSTLTVGEDIEVGCGQVLLVSAQGLEARSLRVAPGGVVRVVDHATIELSDSLLVCPGATVQAGADPVRTGPVAERALDGHRLALLVPTAVVLGTIESRGSTYLVGNSGPVGDGGDIDIEVERLLHAGLIDVSGAKYGGVGGNIRIVVSNESYFSGVIKTTGGYIKMDVPVL